MVGSPRSQAHDNPYPTLGEVWRLEVALTKVERDYDIVIIDTPPSINGLTRTAWVASDRVLIVAEPSLFSVVATDRTIHAVEELRKGLTPRLGVLGILINRLKPAAPENEFRVNEIREKYGNLALPTVLEERSSLQQATGSARAIHSWPGQTSQEIAAQFDEVLDFALDSFANQQVRRPTRAERKAQRVTRIMRGQTLDQVLALESEEPAEPGEEETLAKELGL
jgi:cellulose biosynthesis protein BcsQ